MIETGDVAQLRLAVQEWRRAGERIAFVPTMGNLHAGHYALVERAHRLCGRVIASVFVNPTQFGPNEDYARYPRTLAEDRAGLLRHGCDLLFVPEVATLYPYGSEATVRVEVPEVTQTLDGLARPGHFAGVATVVTKLFNMVQPDVAVFGQKDYQQVQVIRRMVRDLALPVEIVMAPTERAADGLALSSRNGYLSAAHRAVAPELHRCLLRMAEAVRQGEPLDAIEAKALASLSAAGFLPDYATIRRDDSLSAPQPDQRNGLVALIAARLGGTRLIDNLLIQ